jgi:hypothetical protein
MKYSVSTADGDAGGLFAAERVLATAVSPSGGRIHFAQVRQAPSWLLVPPYSLHRAY